MKKEVKHPEICCVRCPQCHKKVKIELLKQHLKEKHNIDS